MSETKHRYFPAIENTIHFDRRNNGPIVRPLFLIAVEQPSLSFPRTRISLCGPNGTTGLTVHQAATLRDQLDEAIGVVVAACPQMSTPDEIETLPKEVIRG